MHKGIHIVIDLFVELTNYRLIYIYVCVCLLFICLFICRLIYIYMCVCVYVCMLTPPETYWFRFFIVFYSAFCLFCLQKQPAFIHSFEDFGCLMFHV